MPGPGGPRGGHGGGPGGHRPGGIGHRPYRRGFGCSGCLMPVLGTIAVIVLLFSVIF